MNIHQGEAALCMLKFNLLVYSLQRDGDEDFQTPGKAAMIPRVVKTGQESECMAKESQDHSVSLHPEERFVCVCKMQCVWLIIGWTFI